MPTLDLKRDDLLWLAGLLEGEGCFSLNNGKYPEIRLQMNDKDVVQRVAELMGSNVRVKSMSPGRYSDNEAFVTSKQGPRAAELMRALFPFMGQRRSERINAILGS